MFCSRQKEVRHMLFSIHSSYSTPRRQSPLWFFADFTRHHKCKKKKRLTFWSVFYSQFKIDVHVHVNRIDSINKCSRHTHACQGNFIDTKRCHTRHNVKICFRSRQQSIAKGPKSHGKKSKFENIKNGNLTCFWTILQSISYSWYFGRERNSRCVANISNDASVIWWF